MQGVLQGHNGTILAYGQTGSGKTHTILGSMKNPQLMGIIPRALQEISREMLAVETHCKASVSLIEIYCERICDLLNPTNSDLQVSYLLVCGDNVGSINALVDMK